MPFELSYMRRQDNSKINADLGIIVTYYRNTETRDLSLTHTLPLFLSQNHTPQKLNNKYFVLQSKVVCLNYFKFEFGCISMKRIFL